MTRRFAALLAAVVFHAVLAAGAPAMAQSEEAKLNAYVVNAPIAGLPQGPYSRWTEAQRKMALGRINGFCRYLCVDRYRDQAFKDKMAAERAMAEAKVCLGACFISHLPADSPQAASLKRELHADHEKAMRLGSTVPWPLPEK
jgi:hypothetical protein